MTNRKMPLVSIGVPTVNRANELRRALGRLAEQTYRNIEIIISDNASEDATPQVCEEFVSNDSRIRYCRQTNRIGPHDNFRFVLDSARGEFFMWAADDDMWSVNYVEALMKGYERRPNANLSFAEMWHINEKAERMGPAHTYDFERDSWVRRLCAYCVNYVDQPIYGLHRTEALRRIRPPVWWFNKQSLAHIGYVYVGIALLAGEYVWCGNQAYFEKSEDNRKHYSLRGRVRVGISSVVFSFFRHLNVAYCVSAQLIRYWRRPLRAVVAFCVLSARLLFDFFGRAVRMIMKGQRIGGRK